MKKNPLTPCNQTWRTSYPQVIYGGKNLLYQVLRKVDKATTTWGKSCWRSSLKIVILNWVSLNLSRSCTQFRQSRLDLLGPGVQSGVLCWLRYAIAVCSHPPQTCPPQSKLLRQQHSSHKCNKTWMSPLMCLTPKHATNLSHDFFLLFSQNKKKMNVLHVVVSHGVLEVWKLSVWWICFFSVLCLLFALNSSLELCFLLYRS